MRKIFAVLLAAALLCGCSANTSRDDASARQATEAVNIISNETLVDLIRLNLAYQTASNQAQYLTKLESMAEITVTDYTQTDDCITATVTIVAPNMYNIAKDMENQVFSDTALLDEEICVRLGSCQDFVTKTCSLTFRYVEEDWAVDFSEEFSDALYGGLITYRNEYLAAWEVQ